MKLTFLWGSSLGRMSPSCDSTCVNKDGVNLLSCLLNDDGGIDHPSWVPWIEEGISRIDAVTSGAVAVGDWSREAWGARLTSEVVTIHSLYEEDYAELFATPRFRRALVAWLEFVQSMPDADVTQEIEI